MNTIATDDLEHEDFAAAMVEEWVTETLGKRSVGVLALVIGRLCARFGVEPEAAADVIRRSRNAERAHAAALHS